MKLQEHPLWPTLKEWAAEGPLPLVTFGNIPQFEQNVNLAALVDPLWGHVDAKAGFWQTYANAAALGRFLVGGENNIDVHALLYRVSAHRLGKALCYAARVAVELPDRCADFSDSTRREGFVTALEAWAALFLQEGFDGRKELRWVTRNLFGVDQNAADFWVSACQYEIGDTVEFAKILAHEHGNAEAAKRMQEQPKQRKAKPRTSEFKDRLQCFWVPAALWCKSDAEIVELLEPDRKDKMPDAYDRVRRDVSELGLSKSRRRST